MTVPDTGYKSDANGHPYPSSWAKLTSIGTLELEKK